MTHATVLDEVTIVEPWPFQVVEGRGSDGMAFLHRLLSGPVAAVGEGEGCHTLLLDTKGHVQSDIQLYRMGNDVRLVVAEGQGQATAAALSRYAIMDDFSATLADTWAAFVLVGAGAAAALARVGVNVPADVAVGARWRHAQLDDVWVVRQRTLGAPALEVWAAPARKQTLLAELQTAGVAVMPAVTSEALRVAAGEARFGLEVTPERFPMELGLDEAIDYTKGCYLGQEPIVRIRDRGHVNWGLRRLRLAPAAPVPAAGDKLESDSRPAAGHITSAAALPASGDAPAVVVALALVHKTVGDGPVRVLTAQGPFLAQVLPLQSSSALDRGGLD